MDHPCGLRKNGPAAPSGAWLLTVICVLLCGCHQRIDDFRTIALDDTPAMVAAKVGPRDDIRITSPASSVDIWRNGDGTEFEVHYDSGKVRSAFLRTKGMYSAPNIAILAEPMPQDAGNGIFAPR